jgi:hypothetical protein
MSAPRVVEALDVVEHVGSGFISGTVDLAQCLDLWAAAGLMDSELS